jgi:pimeloyl-ACP methyl ester carboxylesterase
MNKAIAVVAGWVCLSGCAASSSITSGTLGPSRVMIASPARWNGDLLILAHGYAPPTAPLSVGFDANSTPYRELLDQGWMVAATSYRRNGTIIRDAAEDVELLRRHVASRFGRPQRTFVLGWSMGGAIGAMIAETRGREYSGVLVVGAALQMRDANEPYVLTHCPRVPLLFLTNRSELQGPVDYLSKLEPNAPAANWLIRRDGHCNVRDVETRSALDALVRWAQTGRIEPGRDATIPADDLPSVATHKDGRAYAKITRVTQPFGNIHTPFVRADLVRLGVAPGSRFLVGKGDKAFPLLFGTDYYSVPRGEWVAFLTADGWLEVARNMDNSAKELGCENGDEIWIAKDAGK